MVIARLLTPVPKDADSTKEFKASLKLERGLDAKMKVLVNNIRRTGQMSEHQRLLMRDSIRNSVQRIWVIGAQYAANFMERELIMTQTDIENIKALSQEFGDRMQWRIDNYVLNRMDSQEENSKAEISTDFITSTFAGYVAPRSLSVAIREKARQITQSQFQSDGFGAMAAAASAADTTQEPHVVLKWITANDDKVCPICSTLEGTLFEVDDPDVPEPDSDTHPSCRCMLRLVEAEFQ